MFRIVFALATVAAVCAETALSVQQVSGRFGSFSTHDGYPKTPYARGQRTRFMIKFPAGVTGEVGIDVTNPATFSMRSYDFAVILDASIASKVQHPCEVESYTAAGQKDVDYVSITMTNRAQPRILLSKNDTVYVDFCPSTYDSGRNDPTMKGFQVFYMATYTPAPPSTMMPSSMPPSTTPMPTTSVPHMSSTGVAVSTPAPTSPSPTSAASNIPASSTGAMMSSTVPSVATSTPPVSQGTSSAPILQSSTGAPLPTSTPVASSSVSTTPSFMSSSPVSTVTSPAVTSTPVTSAPTIPAETTPPATDFAQRPGRGVFV